MARSERKAESAARNGLPFKEVDSFKIRLWVSAVCAFNDFCRYAIYGNNM